LPRKFRSLYLEPSRGCTGQCRGCILGELPKTPTPMDPNRYKTTLESNLRRLVESDQLGVDLTGGGNPLDNRRLPEIIALTRGFLPQSLISCFWSGLGIRSKKELVARVTPDSKILFSKLGAAASELPGVNRLIVSIDAHHWAALRRQMNADSGCAPKKEQVFEQMREHLRWANSAAGKIGARTVVRIAAGRRETLEFLQNVVEKALEPSAYELQLSSRSPRGSSLGQAKAIPTLHIWHDCTVTERVPESLMILSK